MKQMCVRIVILLVKIFPGYTKRFHKFILQGKEEVWPLYLSLYNLAQPYMAKFISSLYVPYRSY